MTAPPGLRSRLCLACAASVLLSLPSGADERERNEESLRRLLSRAEFEETTIDTLQAEVAELGQVAFRASVPVDYVDADGLARYLESLIEEEYPAADAEIDARVLRAFDLLPDGVELRSLRRRLMEENVVGFYDTRPERRQLFAVSSSGEARLDPSNQMILAHELRHALQDQYLDLHSLLSGYVSDFDDRTLAMLSLLEGDATFVMERYVLRRVPAARRRQPRRLAGAPMPPLPGAPAILRDQMIAPYVRGRDFAMAVWERDGWEGLRAAWDAPPVSTEQVLHPERYFAGELPTPVAPPASWSGATPLRTGVLGELMIGTLVGCEGPTCAPAEGWGGDAFSVWDEGGATRLGWVVEWESRAEAEEFWEAATARFRERHGEPESVAGAWCYAGGGWRFRWSRSGSRVELWSDDLPGETCATSDTTALTLPEQGR